MSVKLNESNLVQFITLPQQIPGEFTEHAFIYSTVNSSKVGMWKCYISLVMMMMYLRWWVGEVVVGFFTLYQHNLNL